MAPNRPTVRLAVPMPPRTSVTPRFSAGLNPSPCLSLGDGVHEAFDVLRCDGGNRQTAKQGTDVAIDSAAVCQECASGLGPLHARQEAASLGIGQVRITEFAYGHRGALGLLIGGGILPLSDQPEQAVGLLPGFIGRPRRSVTTNRVPP